MLGRMQRNPLLRFRWVTVLFSDKCDQDTDAKKNGEDRCRSCKSDPDPDLPDLDGGTSFGNPGENAVSIERSGLGFRSVREQAQLDKRFGIKILDLFTPQSSVMLKKDILGAHPVDGYIVVGNRACSHCIERDCRRFRSRSGLRTTNASGNEPETKQHMDESARIEACQRIASRNYRSLCHGSIGASDHIRV